MRITTSILATFTLALVLSGWATAQEAHRASPEVEAQQLAILRSEAPSGEKALACKRLAIDGSYAAVPELAGLLRDPQLASWSRIALEAIPGPEADEALRQATVDLDGPLLIGVINSIGVRRDPQAVAPLVARLADKDTEVASAAAVALGNIGTPEAASALRKSLAVEAPALRSAAALGCVLCAERALEQGDPPTAVALYDEVRRSQAPPQRVLEATRGAILARGDDGIELLVEQLRSPDVARFHLGLKTAREFPGGKVDPALAAELKTAAPERAALIVQAMADRPQTVSREALVQAATSGPVEVRRAAIAALGRVGDASSLPTLLTGALDADAELAATAKAALASLPGEDVNAKVVALLDKAQGQQYPLLIAVIGDRRIPNTAALERALQHDDAKVRAAALAALGETIGPRELATLITQVVSPGHAEDRATAARALQAAAIRMPDREVCAAELVTALEGAKSTEIKASLLECLAGVGGTKALAAVGAATRGADPQLQDIGSRALGEWMTEDAGPVLLELAQTSKDDKLRSRALRGYLRIARQFDLPVERRVAMCNEAYTVARQAAERKFILETLRRYPTSESFDLALTAMKSAETRGEATATALVLAQKLSEQGVDVGTRLAQAGIEPVQVEIVKAEYGAGENQRDVTEVLRKHVTRLPLVVLPASYNGSFGGDPAPGVAKRLRVEYRLDGRKGEAEFAENAVIVLPAVK